MIQIRSLLQQGARNCRNLTCALSIFSSLIKVDLSGPSVLSLKDEPTTYTNTDIAYANLILSQGLLSHLMDEFFSPINVTHPPERNTPSAKAVSFHLQGKSSDLSCSMESVFKESSVFSSSVVVFSVLAVKSSVPAEGPLWFGSRDKAGKMSISFDIATECWIYSCRYELVLTVKKARPVGPPQLSVSRAGLESFYSAALIWSDKKNAITRTVPYFSNYASRLDRASPGHLSE